MSRPTTSTRVSFLRSLAIAKVRCGAYTSIEAICDELKGKAQLYRTLYATKRLNPATIQAWEIDAKIFAKAAVEHFREIKHG